MKIDRHYSFDFLPQGWKNEKKLLFLLIAALSFITACSQERLTVTVQELDNGSIEVGTVVETSGQLTKDSETVTLNEQRMKSASCTGGMGGNPMHCGNMTLETVTVTYHVYTLSRNGNSITVLSKNSDLKTGQVTLTGTWSGNGLKL